MKEDFAGVRLPSGSFGEKATWGWIVILALKLSMDVRKQIAKLAVSPSGQDRVVVA